MTAPYRLRDGIGDWQAMASLVLMVICAAALGVFPTLVNDYGLVVLAYVVFWTGLLLVNMQLADRRLREVSAS